MIPPHVHSMVCLKSGKTNECYSIEITIEELEVCNISFVGKGLQGGN